MNKTADITPCTSLGEFATVHEASNHTCDNVPTDLIVRGCSKRKTVDSTSNTESKKICSNSSQNVEYQGSDSTRKQRLPLPMELLGMFANKSETNVTTDDESAHQGRIRSFPHERGNWATHVFIEYDLDVSCDELFLQLLDILPELVLITDLHISVSKTVILRHHWIQPFVDSLKNKLQHISRFFMTLDSLKFYTNEEKTRTFLGIQLNQGTQQLREIVKCVDSCLEEFSLPTFYKEPSFHISIGWCLGDRVQTLSEKLPKLQDTLDSYYQNDNQQMTVIKVDQIKCRTGNKLFIIPLHKI